MTIQDEYQKSVNRRTIPPQLLSKTSRAMNAELNKLKKTRFRWAIAIPVCGLVVFSVSALAYAVKQYAFPKSSYEARINNSVPSQAMAEAGQQINKTIEKNGLIITVKNTVCDKSMMYIDFQVKTKTGTPLIESSEYRKSFLSESKFSTCQVTVSGVPYQTNLFRCDNGSAPDTAEFEASVDGNFADKNEADAVLTLGDYTDTVNTCQDAGFLFKNLGELYRSMTPENPKNFIKTGIYLGGIADKTLANESWTIPAGKQHIAFSSQFPNSYIDNIGFHKTGEPGIQIDVLYISITPGNEKEAAGLKKLCFQNTNTMSPSEFYDAILTGSGNAAQIFDAEQRNKAIQDEINQKLKFNGNRIVIGLDLFISEHDGRDCTVADLDHYRLVKNYGTESVIRSNGSLNIPFTVKYNDTTLKYKNLNKTISAHGNTETIQEVSISDLTLTYSGTNNKIANKASPRVTMVLSDGTLIDAGEKLVGGGNTGGSFSYEILLTHFVDAYDVVALEIWGQRISLK